MNDGAHLLARLDRIETKLDDLSLRVLRAEGRRHATAGVISAIVSLAIGFASVWFAGQIEAAETIESAAESLGGTHGDDVDAMD